ncbi:MAG: FtsQ-type POTRA domain-containing protein [Ignavibacteria bacterium]|nr:FtsQ-type POTRA domain-containing protein [Ignavibacteria bacterium]
MAIFRKYRIFSMLILIALIVVSSVVLANKWKSDSKYDKITVKGNVSVSREEILDIARLKDSLAFNDEINLKIIQDRILRHPEIKKAFVSKQPPDELVIEVIEKRPIAIVSFDNEVKLIDEELELFTYKNIKKIFDLPVISGLKLTPAESQSERLKSDEIRTALFIIMNTYKKNKLLYNNISEINFANPDAVTVYTNDVPFPCYLPRETGLSIANKDYQKILLNRLVYLNNYLTQIYPDNKSKKINYLDLRYSNQIVVNYQ